MRPVRRPVRHVALLLGALCFAGDRGPAQAAGNFASDPAADPEDDPVELRYKLGEHPEKGDAYLEFRQDVEQYLENERGGRSARTKVSQVVGMMRKVEGTADETRLELRFDRVALSYQNASGRQGFDSDKGGAPPGPAASVYRPILGRGFEMHLDPEHRMLRTRGLVEIEADLSRSADLHVVDQLGFLFREDYHKLLWADMQRVLYKGDLVRVGDTWSRRIDPELEPERVMNFSYKIESIDRVRGRVRLSYRATLLRPEGAKAKRSADGSLVSFGKGKLAGTAVYDIARGEFVLQEEESDLFLDLFIRAAGNGNRVKLINKIKRRYKVVSPEERKARKTRLGSAKTQRIVQRH